MKKLAALSAALLATACEPPDTHILAGQLFVPQDHCVEATSGFDVVNGGSVGTNCGPNCLSVGEGDAQATYITTMCGPYPSEYLVQDQNAATGDADPCSAAFQAYFQDGGTCPASEDAGLDATSDATADR